MGKSKHMKKRKEAPVRHCSVCGKAGPEAMRRPGRQKCVRQRGGEKETRTTERSSVMLPSAGNRNYRTEDAACKAGEILVVDKAAGFLRAFSRPTEQGGLQLVGIKFLGPDRNSEPETCVLFVLGVIKPRAVPGRERDTHRGGSVAAVWYI